MLAYEHFYQEETIELLKKKKFLEINEVLNRKSKFLLTCIVVLTVFLGVTFNMLKNKYLSMLPVFMLLAITVSLALLLINHMKKRFLQTLINEEFELDVKIVDVVEKIHKRQYGDIDVDE